MLQFRSKCALSGGSIWPWKWHGGRKWFEYLLPNVEHDEPDKEYKCQNCIVYLTALVEFEWGYPVKKSTFRICLNLRLSSLHPARPTLMSESCGFSSEAHQIGGLQDYEAPYVSVRGQKQQQWSEPSTQPSPSISFFLVFLR